MVTLRWLVAASHLLALAIGSGAICVRAWSLRGTLTEDRLRIVFRADSLWGLAALVWIGTGVWRAFGGLEKGTAYYASSALIAYSFARSRMPGSSTECSHDQSYVVRSPSRSSRWIHGVRRCRVSHDPRRRRNLDRIRPPPCYGCPGLACSHGPKMGCMGRGYLACRPGCSIRHRGAAEWAAVSRTDNARTRRTPGRIRHRTHSFQACPGCYRNRLASVPQCSVVMLR